MKHLLILLALTTSACAEGVPSPTPPDRSSDPCIAQAQKVYDDAHANEWRGAMMLGAIGIASYNYNRNRAIAAEVKACEAK